VAAVFDDPTAETVSAARDRAFGHSAALREAV
jgi:hypothetical protein